jgi:esterase/lipase superfamily enzyme
MLEYLDPNLKKDVFGWHSPALDMHMPIARYGDWGHALLVFPTASGDFEEAERFFLIKSIEPYIFEGKIQVFSIGSINQHAWMNNRLGVAEQAHNTNQFSKYLENEAVPHIRRCLRDDHARVAVTGASFGCFFAANALFRRPDLFDILIGMSGFYDLGPTYLHGYGDDNVYFNNPMSYMGGLSDHGRLETFRRSTQIHLVTGQGAHEAPDASVRFSELLRSKGIPHGLDLWGHDVNHDWPWWRKMLPHYVGKKVWW